MLPVALRDQARRRTPGLKGRRPVRAGDADATPQRGERNDAAAEEEVRRRSDLPRVERAGGAAPATADKRGAGRAGRWQRMRRRDRPDA